MYAGVHVRNTDKILQNCLQLEEKHSTRSQLAANVESCFNFLGGLPGLRNPRKPMSITGLCGIILFTVKCPIKNRRVTLRGHLNRTSSTTAD